MAVCVTGGAGFVGANLIKQLLIRGESVLAIDNLSGSTFANIAAYQYHPRFRFVQTDLADLSACRAAFEGSEDFGPTEAVWHLAANSDILKGTANIEVDLRDTFLTTVNTLRVMEERDIRRILFASSSAIYGDHGEKILTEETGPLLPISNYGAMKLASEAAISAAVEKFLGSALIFRFPNVVGVPATHGVILDFVRRLRDNPSYLQVLGDGTQQKAYLHVSDLIEAMLLLQARTMRKLDVFNIGPLDEGVTVRRIAEETVAKVAPGAELRFGVGNKGWVGDVPYFSYSVRKATAMGWKPSLDSLAAVRRAIAEVARQESMKLHA